MSDKTKKPAEKREKGIEHDSPKEDYYYDKKEKFVDGRYKEYQDLVKRYGKGETFYKVLSKIKKNIIKGAKKPKKK